MQGQSIYPIYSIETLTLKEKDEKQVVTDERKEVSEKLKGNVSKVLVPVGWTVKNGNWKFPFQLPGLSSLIVISLILLKWLGFILKSIL